MKKIVTIAGLSVLLLGCSPDGNTPKIAQDQREVMDQAGQVEAVIQQGAEDRQQQADEQAR